MSTVTCPCPMLEQKKCKPRAHLSVILYRVSMGGVYQLDTSSYNSIIDINSSIAYIRSLVGRIAMVPLVLKRVPTETHHDGKRQVHYTLKIEPATGSSLEHLNNLRSDTMKILAAPGLRPEAPEAENPVFDDGVVVDEDTGEILSEPRENEEKPLDEMTTRESTLALLSDAQDFEVINQCLSTARGTEWYSEAVGAARTRGAKLASMVA